MIMLRTLRRDISNYNEMQTLVSHLRASCLPSSLSSLTDPFICMQEEAQEEGGWKLVHGDVFRPPEFSPMLLSVLAGKLQ